MQSNKVSIEYKNRQIQIAANIRIRKENLILFIHGLGCAKENFDTVWNHRALRDYSIIAFDLPGFGDSPGLDDFSYDLEEHAEVCRCLLIHFPKFNVHVVGHSMGGAVGILLAEKIDDRLISFINVEGNLIGQDCIVSRRKASVSFEDFEKKQLPGLILATALSDEPGRRIWSTLMKKADAKGLYYSSQSLVRWSDSGMLFNKFKTLDCKKVYVYGEKDSFMTILGKLGNIPVICISKSGHFPMNDNPGEFYSFLASYLSS